MTVLARGLADVSQAAERFGVDGVNDGPREPVVRRLHDRVVEGEVGPEEPRRVVLLSLHPCKSHLDVRKLRVARRSCGLPRHLTLQSAPHADEVFEDGALRVVPYRCSQHDRIEQIPVLGVAHPRTEALLGTDQPHPFK